LHIQQVEQIHQVDQLNQIEFQLQRIVQHITGKIRCKKTLSIHTTKVKAKQAHGPIGRELNRLAERAQGSILQ
jgi:hypothetical protein